MASIRTAVYLQDNVTRMLYSMQSAMQATVAGFDHMHQASSQAFDTSHIEIANRELARAESAFSEIEREIREAEQAQQELNDEIRAGTGAADGFLRTLGGIAATYLSIQGVKSLMGLSDELTNTTARLNLINDEMYTTVELQDMIFESAQRSRGLYLQTADAVAKLGLQAGHAFSGNEEIVAFAEQLNKTFVVAGSSAQGVESVMLQLTQAMAAGRLQGEELNAVLDNAQPIVANIQRYLEEVMDIDASNIKELASQGVLTAEIIKNAMFYAAEETNAAFESMPYTYAQVGNMLTNMLLRTFEPFIQVVGRGAQFIHDNWSTLEPIFWGLAAAVLGYAVALGIQTAATWAANGAAATFFATMMANPLVWIAALIGVVIWSLVRWVQAVGGAEIAWMIAVHRIHSALDWLKYGFFVGIHWILMLFDKLAIGWNAAGTGIMNFMGAMKADVLMQLQDLVNGSINIINGFINTLNHLPGVSIDAINHVSFGTAAQLEAEANRQARLANYEAYKDRINADIAAREADLANMKSEIIDASAIRQAEIEAAQAAKLSEATGVDISSYLAQSDVLGHLDDIAKNTGKMSDSLEITEDELKYLREWAAQEAINRFTTAEIKVEMNNNNNINSEMDIDGIVYQLAERLEESINVMAEGI